MINRGGGTARRLGNALQSTVESAFREVGIEPDLHLIDGPQIAKTVQQFRGKPVIAVGGGDGTIAAAAAELAGSDTVLAVLPLGTLNHFAGQIGIASDLGAAAEAAKSGRFAAVDVGRVGGRIFINNASLGLYTRMVRRRDASRLPKVLATIPASWSALSNMQQQELALNIQGKTQTIRSPLLFVGNNRYKIAGREMGMRDSLSAGILSLFALAPKSQLGLIGFGLRALIGRADKHRDFCEVDGVPEFEVLGEGEIDVAHDGEIETMSLPLSFEIQPNALKVAIGPGFNDRSTHSADRHPVV